VLDDGRIAYQLRYPRRGATHRVMTPLELMARLCALVPPPRHPLVRYFGVLSSHSSWRAEVVPRLPSAADAQQGTGCHHGSEESPPAAGHASRESAPSPRPLTPPRPSSSDDAAAPTEPQPAATPAAHAKAWPSTLAVEVELLTPFNVITVRHLERLLGGELLATSPRLEWRQLLRRTFSIDLHHCPVCGSPMCPVAEITDRRALERILEHLATKAAAATAAHRAACPTAPTAASPLLS